MTILVEGFEPDAIAVARLLAGEGSEVRIAGHGAAPPGLGLVAAGVTVEEHRDLDADPGRADVAYLDVWTPEVAPRVAALRRQGTRVTSASELVLERAASRGALTIGVTGTAGKSTTAAFLVQLLDAAGCRVLAAADGRLGHLWVTGSMVEGLARLSHGDVVVLELTSSHLAFMSSSPDVAVITCFWPDHAELHGSPAAYRRAKENIVRHQTATSAVVVNADDPAAVAFADLTPARRFAFCAAYRPGDGAFVRESAAIVSGGGDEVILGRAPVDPPLRQAVLAAGAAAVAAGTPPSHLAGAAANLTTPPHRRQLLGYVGGVAVVDDGMGATPAKAQAALARYPDDSVVLVAGGRIATEGGLAHTTAAERRLLAAACDVVARAARVTILFGPAAAILDPELAARGAETRRAPDLARAFSMAVGESPGAEAIVFSPLFPVSMEERERFAELARAAVAAER